MTRYDSNDDGDSANDGRGGGGDCLFMFIVMTMTTTSVQACDAKGRMHPILFVIEVCCGK